MDTAHEILADEANRLAKSLPYSMMVQVAASLEKLDISDRHASVNRLLRAIPQPNYRSIVSAFLDVWDSQADAIPPQAGALAVLTAANAERANQQGQTVELVWTGPVAGAGPLRRTEQALLQLIESATQRITVVAYAVYRIPRICDALVRAADRGVQITVVVETPDRLEGKNAYNTLLSLGDAVGQRSAVYYWPLENRGKDESGKTGILHVKCAVADGCWILVTSANLTEYAFTVNMELGLLLTGRSLPEQVERHFANLIHKGILLKV